MFHSNNLASSNNTSNAQEHSHFKQEEYGLP